MNERFCWYLKIKQTNKWVDCDTKLLRISAQWLNLRALHNVGPCNNLVKQKNRNEIHQFYKSESLV